VAEKALILFRHAKQAALPESGVMLVQVHGWDIVSHEHFTPERIRRFATARLPTLSGDVEAHVAEELREPTEAMTSSYRALEADHRAVLVSLLDVPPGPVPERDLAAAVRRHSTGGLAHPVNEIVDRLADHFLRVVEPSSVVWVHPSWRDLVIEEVSADAEARRAFLSSCGIHGVVLALSTAGGAAGERSLPLLVDDADWDCVADRIAALAPGLDAPEVTMLLGALDSAREAAEGEGTWLAEGALGTLARCWNRTCAAVPVGLFADWFDLAAKLPDPPMPPSAAPTWFEVVPTDVVDVADDALAFDEWTALVDVLVDHDPAQLPAFGFPQEQLPAMEEFLAGAEAADPAMPNVDAVVRSLRRLAEWLPVPQRAYDAWFRLSPPSYSLEDFELYEPRTLSPEIERILEAPLSSTHDGRDQVARVLRDL